jgi:membrane-associated phospholipid phosphatase
VSSAGLIRSVRARLILAAVLLIIGPFAALTAAVVVTAPGVLGVDAALASRLHRVVAPRPGLGHALELIGVITLPWCLRGLALIAALLLWRRGRGRAAGWLVLTMAAGGLLGAVLKQVFERARPFWPDPITVVNGYSYPSGHALTSMLAAGCLMVLLRTGHRPAARRSRWSTGSGLWSAAGAFVLLVGVDRVALGVHYLTDVLAGWTLGLAVVLAARAAYDPTRRPDPTS